MKKFLEIRKGIISFITLLVLMGVGVLGIGMVITSQLSSTSANNFRHKIQTFNAADGMMTLLAQDVLDFNEGKYITGATDTTRLEAENMTLSTNSPYDYSKESNAAGSGGWIIKGSTSGKTDTAKINFSGTTGMYNVNVWYFDESDGASTFKVFVNNSMVDTWIANLNTSGSSVADATTRKVRTIPGIFIANGNQVMIQGTPDNSEWARVDCIDFVYLPTFTSTAKVGKDSIPVIYSISQLGTNIFSMSTDSYILKGTTQGRNYETHLTQTLAREASGQWHETVHDSASIPATFYDFRGDLTNPEFNMGATDMAMKGMVQNALDAQRKPVPNTNNTLRTRILNWYNSNWYLSSFTPNQRLTTWSNAANNWSTFASCTSGNQRGWCFSDGLGSWFRPQGGTGATFDSLNNAWNNLKHRPKWNGSHWSDSVPNEYVGINYDSTNPFANIVIYDSLKFRETGTNTGIFTFGDSLNSIHKDIQWFDTANGFTRFVKFMPLKNKGYKWDSHLRYTATNPYGCPVPACTTAQNFSFTMEMHRKFTYKPGQTFNFSGDDDVWAFINNQLVIDLGGVHKIMSASVNLDNLGLTFGQEYWFDFFYCERNVCESDILITTNMMFYIPPQPLKRSWKRDYGNLD
ncbi:MAG: fibro-slime domain-containing protein [Chitinivibrionales bacterium]